MRLRGEDVEAGGIVIEPGTVLRPQELGLITSLGLWQVSVHRAPRVALLSTGDEVAEPGTPRQPGQIYDANRFTLRGSIEQCGGEVLDLGIVPDVRDELRARLLEAAAMADVVITSGGVSVGVYDLVKDVLGEIGTIDFWQVAMQPGRPLAFGRIGQTTFFGLPGNPVASMLAFMLFVRPALYKLAGRRRCLPLDVAGARHRAPAQEGRPPRVQARRPDLPRRCVGGPHRRGRRARASCPRWWPATASSSSKRTGATSRRVRWCSSSRSPNPCEVGMSQRITVDLIDRVKLDVRDLLRDAARRLPHLTYADLRLEVAEGKSATAENGESKSSGDDYGFAAGVRVLAGDRSVAPGLGRPHAGYRRPRRAAPPLARGARARLPAGDGQRRARRPSAREKFGALGASLADTRLHPIDVREDTVPASYEIDPAHGAAAPTWSPSPRRLAPGRRRRSGHQAQLRLDADPALARALRLHRGRADRPGVRAHPGHVRWSSAWWARSARSCTTWSATSAAGRSSPAASTMPPLRQPPFADFALALARESVELAAAPALPTSEREEVVVTDPHYNTLVSHEIVGHPVELDRALKMETAYAGRSWLLAALDQHQVGQRDRLAAGERVLRSRRCPATGTIATTTRARRPRGSRTSIAGCSGAS